MLKCCTGMFWKTFRTKKATTLTKEDSRITTIVKKFLNQEQESGDLKAAPSTKPEQEVAIKQLGIFLEHNQNLFLQQVSIEVVEGEEEEEETRVNFLKAFLICKPLVFVSFPPTTREDYQDYWRK